MRSLRVPGPLAMAGFWRRWLYGVASVRSSTLSASVGVCPWIVRVLLNMVSACWVSCPNVPRFSR